MDLRGPTLTLALACACKPAVTEPRTMVADPLSEPGPEPAAESFVAHAKLELHHDDGRERSFDWSVQRNLVSCRYYAAPERGDYLWIRLAESPAQDGDAGVRLDIDVCRLAAITGPLAPMPAGQHGSHCAATPGFAIWWHERDVAFNSGAQASNRCDLELALDPATNIIRGEFDCAPLQLAEPDTDNKTKPARELTLAAGSFACRLEPAS